VRDDARDTRNGAAPTFSAAPFSFPTSRWTANVCGSCRGGGSATVGPGAVGSLAVPAIADRAAVIESTTTVTVIDLAGYQRGDREVTDGPDATKRPQATQEKKMGFLPQVGSARPR